MNETNIREQASASAQDGLGVILPIIAAVAGVLLLAATWFFYKDTWSAAGFEWYQWIRPGLMVLASILCLIAAALLVLRKPAGRDVLLMAACVVPLILLVGLITVALRLVVNVGSRIADTLGSIVDGTFSVQLSVEPRHIAIGAVILAVVLLVTAASAMKSGKSPGEKK